MWLPRKPRKISAMPCRTVLRSSVLLWEPWPWRPPSLHRPPPPLLRPSRATVFYGASPLRCSHSEAPSPASSPSSSSPQDDQGPPQEAVLKAISEVSKSEGRVAQTTNIVIGGTVTDDASNEWLVLDQKVNSYPMKRGFTAIGTGGDDFVQAMVVAVESVLQQPIPKGRVTQKLSSRGRYVSVNIGPIRVVSSEQVQAVYNAMRRDDRMKYFL
ncbi:uncharacterized protein LOC103715842 [Phoenix dactylifera]|uniref:Uncharacterized protein LOC103715842 n=1 Tax=Phoenix dactylifera TaxID=42345 RepID=A0A8B8J9M4_PHODC|nr:uncharacterized protein LOC103715842 [Phoenix dactylifera]